mmetsp:Transcript_19974/g.32488  ORF Transcript_19974/g.32488 Transcript_19974/m.32488 type:complete len:415 (-) Transcript_19974:1924-3168(-)
MRKLQAQFELLEDLTENVELPGHVKTRLSEIVEEVEDCNDYMEEKKQQLSRDSTRWVSYVPIVKPALKSLAPAAGMYLAMKANLPYLMVFAMICGVIFMIFFPSYYHELSDAWEDVLEKEVYEMADRLRTHQQTLREYATLQSQLRSSRVYDVSNILQDPNAQQFWVANFGANVHAVETDRLIETLLYETDENIKLHSQKARHAIYLLLFIETFCEKLGWSRIQRLLTSSSSSAPKHLMIEGVEGGQEEKKWWRDLFGENRSLKESEDRKNVIGRKTLQEEDYEEGVDRMQYLSEQMALLLMYPYLGMAQKEKIRIPFNSNQKKVMKDASLTLLSKEKLHLEGVLSGREYQEALDQYDKQVEGVMLLAWNSLQQSKKGEHFTCYAAPLFQRGKGYHGADTASKAAPTRSGVQNV